MSDPQQAPTPTPARPDRLALDYFDGRQGRARGAEIWREGAELLLCPEGGTPQRHAWRAVQWPERRRHGRRLAQLPDGGVLSCADPAAWDAWAARAGLQQPLAARWMQSWRGALAALALLIVLVGLGWRWGIPLASDAIQARIPDEVEAHIGAQVLQQLDAGQLRSSGLAAARQAAIAADFARLVEQHRARGQVLPAYRLHFRDGGKLLGPNAFALPGGDIVLTDALVELMADRPEAVLGVLGHELGHLRHHHGMRQVLRASLVGVASAMLIGDFSSLMAAAPALLATRAYSRDFEREADAEAKALMRAGALPPQAMALFFERIAEQAAQRGASLPIAISSHPADAERRAFFTD